MGLEILDQCSLAQAAARRALWWHPDQPSVPLPGRWPLSFAAKTVQRRLVFKFLKHFLSHFLCFHIQANCCGIVVNGRSRVTGKGNMLSLVKGFLQDVRKYCGHSFLPKKMPHPSRSHTALSCLLGGPGGNPSPAGTSCFIWKGWCCVVQSVVRVKWREAGGEALARGL